MRRCFVLSAAAIALAAVLSACEGSPVPVTDDTNCTEWLFDVSETTQLEYIKDRLDVDEERASAVRAGVTGQCESNNRRLDEEDETQIDELVDLVDNEFPKN